MSKILYYKYLLYICKIIKIKLLNKYYNHFLISYLKIKKTFKVIIT